MCSVHSPPLHHTRLEVIYSIVIGPLQCYVTSAVPTLVMITCCLLTRSVNSYVVNSCLAPPLNPDNEAVSHSATCSTNLL